MKRKTKDDFIIEMPDTGVCKIDIEKLIKCWDDKFFITGHSKHKEYTLNRRFYKGGSFSFTISEQDAIRVANRLNLTRLGDDFFKLEFTFCSVGFILESIHKLHKRKIKLFKESDGDSIDYVQLDWVNRKIEHYKKFI